MKLKMNQIADKFEVIDLNTKSREKGANRRVINLFRR